MRWSPSMKTVRLVFPFPWRTWPEMPFFADWLASSFFKSILPFAPLETDLEETSAIKPQQFLFP